jgi:hypothetical protein
MTSAYHETLEEALSEAMSEFNDAVEEGHLDKPDDDDKLFVSVQRYKLDFTECETSWKADICVEFHDFMTHLTTVNANISDNEIKKLAGDTVRSWDPDWDDFEGLSH